MTIVIYQTIPEETIRSDAKDTIEKITQWFKDNPKRKVCRAEVWYGRVVHVKRKTVAEQINAAADKAIEKPSRIADRR